MDTLWLLLSAYGICFGLMNDKLEFINRNLYKLPLFRDEENKNLFERMFSCAYCTGFHAGWLVWIPTHWKEGIGIDPFLGVLLFSLTSSAFSYSLDTALRWFEQKSDS